VNTSQINAGPFNYLILTEYPHLRVESLIDRFDEASPYRRLFGHEYVAVKRINAGMNPSQKEVIGEILGGPPHLFASSYELETTYDLPDGDTVYLYRRRYDLPANYPVEYVAHVAEALNGRTRSGDAILLTPPELAGPFVAAYTGPGEVYVGATTEEDLATIAQERAAGGGRILLVVGDAAAGEVEAGMQGWLDEHTFRASHEWIDSLQLVVYGLADGEPATSPSVALGARLGGDSAKDAPVALVGYDLPAGPWQGGDVVPLSLFWQARGSIEEDYTVFVHLLDEGGSLVAQNDSAPGGRTRPTSGWQPGEIVVDRRGLLLAGEGVGSPGQDLTPGRYEMRLGMYVPASGSRLAVWDGEGNLLGDSISLGYLTVE
jgi:hypothetical protein